MSLTRTNVCNSMNAGTTPPEIIRFNALHFAVTVELRDQFPKI